MKIGQEVHSQVDTKHVRQTSESRTSFEKLINVKVHQVKRDELKKLLTEISNQGKRLAQFRSFQDLAKFKHMIKDFLHETVYSGLKLQESHNFNPNGYSQKLAIVKKVDEKLIELTEEIMNQEKKTIDLLSIIGEIKGLLINLYA